LETRREERPGGKEHRIQRKSKEDRKKGQVRKGEKMPDQKKKKREPQSFAEGKKSAEKRGL